MRRIGGVKGKNGNGQDGPSERMDEPGIGAYSNNEGVPASGIMIRMRSSEDDGRPPSPKPRDRREQ